MDVGGKCKSRSDVRKLGLTPPGCDPATTQLRYGGSPRAATARDAPGRTAIGQLTQSFNRKPSCLGPLRCVLEGFVGPELYVVFGGHPCEEFVHRRHCVALYRRQHWPRRAIGVGDRLTKIVAIYA